MDFEVSEEPVGALPTLSELSIAFVVDRILDLVPQESGLGGLALHERPLAAPYLKDYDAIVGNRPCDWLSRFDVAHWGFITARSGGRLIGAAVIAYDTPTVTLLENRRDLAVLWDIRVAPDARGQHVGAALFQAAAEWAASKGCRLLKIETQNTNVAACRFYARQGCTLGASRQFAYEELPHETQLLWYKELPTPASAIQ